MIELQNYFIAENEEENEKAIELNKNAEKEFNGLYAVVENGELKIQNQTYDFVQVPESILNGIDEIKTIVNNNGDDVHAFNYEVDSFLKNNGYSLKRTSQSDFGALYE